MTRRKETLADKVTALGLAFFCGDLIIYLLMIVDFSLFGTFPSIEIRYLMAGCLVGFGVLFIPGTFGRMVTNTDYPCDNQIWIWEQRDDLTENKLSESP